MKKKCLTLLLAIALVVTNVEGAGLLVHGADFTSEEVSEVNEIQMAKETPKSKNGIVKIALIKKKYYDVFTFLDEDISVKITYKDGTTRIETIDLHNENTKYNDKYGNTYYYSFSRKRTVNVKGWTYVFSYYVTDAEGNKKTFTDQIQVSGIAEMPRAEINKKYQIKKNIRYTVIPSRTAEYTITYTGDSNMWFWEVNEWEPGRYSLGFVDREKNDYGSYKVVKSKLEKGKKYVITTVDDNSFYLSILETKHEKITKLAKKATCKEKGYTGDVYCKNCGKLLTKGKVIEKLSHKWSKWKKISGATVLKPAKQQRYCTLCKSVQTKDSGNKLKSVMKVNYNTITLKTKKSTGKLKVSGMAKGDYVTKVQSGNTGIVKVVKFTKDGKIQLAAQRKTGTAKITIRLAGGAVKSVTVKVQK